MEDFFVTIPPDARARHHLTMITAMTAFYAMEELDERAPWLGISEIIPYRDVLAMMQKLQSAPEAEPIPLNEHEFTILHGCCLLSSLLLLHEGGEALLAPFIAQVRENKPQTGMDFARLRHFVLIQNEQMAKGNEPIVRLFPSMQAMERAVEALSF